MRQDQLSNMSWKEIRSREGEIRMKLEERIAQRGSYSERVSRIDLVKPGAEPEEVKNILDEVMRLTGRPALANTYYVWAHNPALLRGKWFCIKATMFEGTLPKALMDSISIVIDAAVGCKS